MKWLIIAALAASLPACAQRHTDIVMTQQDHNRSLQKAATSGDTAGIRAALSAGASIETRDNQGRTPLMLAVYGEHTDAAAALIASGANVNAQDQLLNSPFLYAGAEGLTEIVRLCMKSGADYKVYNRYGGSALIPACERGHVETVKALLSDKNFPIDHINRLGWTGLLEAIILGNGGAEHTEIVRLLIQAGTNVNIADKDGVTPLAHARQKRQQTIVRLLEAAGAK
ncbi:ankyrin repeat domain-containing protein [Chitinophaga lutea]